MMGESLQGIRYCTKMCNLVETFLKLIHDARTDEHKILRLCHLVHLKSHINSWTEIETSRSQTGNGTLLWRNTE
jgi:hypothetical protein